MEVILLVIIFLVLLISFIEDSYKKDKRKKESFLETNKEILYKTYEKSYHKTNENKSKNYKIKKGIEGENFICDLIKNNIDAYYKIVRNVYIQMNDKKTEIDIVLITSFGIYIIESKNYSGYIYGSQKNPYWTQYFSKNKKNTIANPIVQNEYHIDFISNYLNRDKSYFKSYIVFGKSTKSLKVNCNLESVKVIRSYQIIESLIDDMHNSDIIFSHEEVDKIYIDLKYYCEHLEIN